MRDIMTIVDKLNESITANDTSDKTQLNEFSFKDLFGRKAKDAYRADHGLDKQDAAQKPVAAKPVSGGNYYRANTPFAHGGGNAMPAFGKKGVSSDQNLGSMTPAAQPMAAPPPAPAPQAARPQVAPVSKPYDPNARKPFGKKGVAPTREPLQIQKSTSVPNMLDHIKSVSPDDYARLKNTIAQEFARLSSRS